MAQDGPVGGRGANPVRPTTAAVVETAGAHVAHTAAATPTDGPSRGSLSEREREILRLMAEGLTNSGIAKRLFVSERTVEAHVRHLLSKLDIPQSEDGHRRVLAVLAHLSAARDQR